MEVGVRVLGIVLRLLNLLLAPLFWLRSRDRRRLTPPAPLLLRSATQHAAAVRNGEITSEELVTVYIERVKEVNPLLNAIVEERYRAALEDAKEVDRRIREARQNGTLEQLVEDKPILGVPFTVKESCSLGGMLDGHLEILVPSWLKAGIRAGKLVRLCSALRRCQFWELCGKSHHPSKKNVHFNFVDR
ncbi:hypothetical protein evm_014817 [Chilo suppressalis]|nr:hypothetical protein evm_014817 [Chilo suppressalis]